jgi:hypothetical protein
MDRLARRLPLRTLGDAAHIKTPRALTGAPGLLKREGEELDA